MSTLSAPNWAATARARLPQGPTGSPRRWRPPGGGLALGLIASVSVAVFYAVFDILAARGGFYTINLLGKAVFRGVRDPAILQYPILPDAPAMLMYTGLHLGLSLVIGFVVARILVQAERHPVQAPQMLLVIVAGCIVTILAVGAFTRSMRPLLPWWSIVVANLLAVAVAGGVLASRHPGLVRRLLLPGPVGHRPMA